MTNHTITLETTDYTDSDFQQFCKDNSIAVQPLGEGICISWGSGEMIRYTAQRDKLVLLLNEYFGGVCNCGDTYAGTCKCISKEKHQ